MRFDQAMAAGALANRAHDPIQYPKYVDVEGNAVLALNAAHEVELLGVSQIAEPVDGGSNAPVNLLSAPEKRGPGRPRLIHQDKE
jgi:hypothetical protein